MYLTFRHSHYFYYIVYFHDLIVKFSREVYEEPEMEEEPAVSHRSYYMERTAPSMSPSKAGPGRKVDSLHDTI